MSGEGKKPVGEQVAKGGLCGILLLLGAFLLLAFLAAAPYVLQMLYHLLCGWVLHGWKALPHLFGKWQEAVLPLGCLLIAAVIAHRFVSRWVGEKFPERTWRIRHTAGALSLLLLGSAAAIAASGVVHQMFWLATGKVIQSNMRRDLAMATSNGRQLMMALLEYENENGRYPHTFEELEMEAGEYSGMIRRLWWLDTRDGKVPEPWILLRPGSSEVAMKDEPVIVSPVIAGEGMVVVGYGDFTVRRIRVENLAEVISQDGTGESGGGR